jgi:hypothetical protein
LGFKKRRGREEGGNGWQKSCFTLRQREGKRWNDNPQETQREGKKGRKRWNEKPQETQREGKKGRKRWDENSQEPEREGAKG